MHMIRKSLLVFALCFSGVAHASGAFTGTWSGQGSASNFDGSWQSGCTPMTLKIEQTESRLSVLKGEFICGQATLEWEPTSLEIRDSLLYSHGYQVGTVSANKVDFTFASAGFHWRVTLENKDGALHYREVQDGGANGLSVEGIFTRN